MYVRMYLERDPCERKKSERETDIFYLPREKKRDEKSPTRRFFSERISRTTSIERRAVTSASLFSLVKFNEPMLPRIYRAHDQRRSSQDVRITCTELRSDAIRAPFLHEKERKKE